MASKIITVLQVIISILLIASILIQAKGVGLGSTFGGEGSFYRSKRGVEKLLVYATISLVTIFFIVSVIGILLNR